MAMSLLRSLSANVIRNVATLRRDAKRLQKHSQEVFGTEYPLTTCQRAMAVARGFTSLHEVERLAVRLGMDRKAPFFTLHARNDVHQSVLDTLYGLQLELTESKPVVLMGEQQHAILPALVLFLEEMSFKKRPGLVLIETTAASRQDTVLQGAIDALGVEEMISQCRTLDLREKNLPMSLNTTARWWTQVISDVLPRDVEERMERSGWRAEFERNTENHARGRNQIFGSADFPAVPFYSVNHVAHSLVGLPQIPEWVTPDEDDGHGMLPSGRKPPKLVPSDEQAIFNVIDALSARNFDQGITGGSESKWRPFVALFSREDPASEVLAGVLHSYFYWRGDRDSRSPILYLSEGATPWAPRCLTFGDHTVVVNGLSTLPDHEQPGSFYGYKNALQAMATDGALQYMGTRLRYP